MAQLYVINNLFDAFDIEWFEVIGANRAILDTEH